MGLTALVAATVDVTRAARYLAVETMSSPKTAAEPTLVRNTTFDLTLIEDGRWDAETSDQYNAEVTSPRGKFQKAIAHLQEQAAKDLGAFGEDAIGGMLSPTPPLLPMHGQRRPEMRIWELNPPDIIRAV